MPVKPAKQTRHPKPDQDRTVEAKARFIELYRATGTIYLAAHNAGVARSHVYAWKAADPEFAAAMKQAELETVEFLESKAIELARGGDAGMIQWLLKCLNRDKFSDRIRHEFETKTMDLLIAEIIGVLQKRIPELCPHCKTYLDLAPAIAADLKRMSETLVGPKVVA